jgi:hypothetical protein
MIRLVNPIGARVGHPEPSRWTPANPTAAAMLFYGEYAAPTPELLRRVLEGLQRLNALC